MAARFDLVTIDSQHPDRLATFWCTAAGLRETEREDGDRWLVLSDADGTRRIGLQRGEHSRGGVHLDLTCKRDELEAEVARLVALGAALLRPVRHESYGTIANLADLDGNLFDLCAYS